MMVPEQRPMGGPMDVTVTKADGRYEARVGDRPAGLMDYRDENRLMVITHTEVAPEFEGHGVGGALVRTALDEWRKEGRRVLPLCPFAKAWIERHPEYADLVTRKHP